MATVKTNKSPMHITCTVGYPYGVQDSGYSCGYHTGCDFPETGTSEKNPDVYSVVEDGEVVYIYKDSTGRTPALGNQVQIKDNKTGHFYRYCHLLHGSISVNIGDKVNLSTRLAKMRKHWKFNRYTSSFRTFDITGVAMWKFLKSCRTFRNTKCSWDCCRIFWRNTTRATSTNEKTKFYKMASKKM